MSIQRYVNFENINTNIENEGKRIQEKDLFIFSQNQKENVDFGNCKYDVLEVAVYDINNNLLPQKSGNNVSYLKMPDIKNYLYNVTKNTGQKELAIDIEKLMNDLGFFTGIYKVNIHFVKNKIGSDNEFTRVWIHEVSPTREEIRILPLISDNQIINIQNKKEFDNILDLSKEFKNYKNSILTFLSKNEQELLKEVSFFIESTYGKDYMSILQKDFGLSKFDDLKNKIYQDFKTSVEYYLNNRFYNIGETNYGKLSPIRFEDCESYDFSKIIAEIKIILYDCILYDTTFLKKRNITVTKITKDFAIPELRKEIKNNLDSFEVEKHDKRIIYQPDKVEIPYKEETNEYNYDEKNDARPITSQPVIEVKEEEKPTPTPTPTPRTRIEPVDMVQPIIPEEQYTDIVIDSKPEPSITVLPPIRVRGSDDSDEKKYEKVRDIKQVEKELNETIVKLEQPKRTSRTRGV